MGYKFHENRGEHGFTLMELLSVVLIIGILAVIAIPNVLSLSKRLQIAKLDEFARQIYLAAQNETVKMKASGRLDAFYIEVEENRKEWSLETLNQRPEDYPENDTAWKLLYYIPSDHELTREFFLQAGSALNVATEKGGSFIMEMDPLTGSVYSVFYAERESLKYSEVTDLYSRARDVRGAASIGYYCGAAGNSSISLPTEFKPEIEITNGEELRAVITCGGMMRINGTQRKLKLLVTVTDEKGRSWTKEFVGGSDELSVVGDEASVSVLLDSAPDGGGFYDLTGKMLTPGDDIIVKAEFIYLNGDVVISGSAEGTANSLFAYRRDDGEGGLEIGISHVRHLNNLRESRYVQENGKKVTILQTNAIHFKSSEVAITTFRPIISQSLFENASVTYDGGGNLLTGFVIENSGEAGGGTGLFQKAENCTLKNIRLADCAVNGRQSTGALAGTVKSAVITNCGVFLTTKDGYGRPYDMEPRIEAYKVTGGNMVGGLIGNAVNSRVVNCFAAVSVESAMSAPGSFTERGNTGGLIGIQSGGETVGCYSSGDVVTYQTGGGLTGCCENGVISDSYSTSDVTVEENGGGFVGDIKGARVENCRSYGLVRPENEAVQGKRLGGFAGYIESGDTFSNCYYLSQAKYNDQFTNIVPGITAGQYRLLKSPTLNAAENSDPYSSSLAHNAFPFPHITWRDGKTGGVMKHYGDWPAELKLQTSLVYYERYVEEDGTESYGYYAVTSLTSTGEGEDQAQKNVNNWKVDTLKSQVCVEDGYAVITPFALTELQYKLNAKEGGDFSDSTKVAVGTGPSDATRLGEKVSLTFRSKNESGEEIEYTISDCFIFRLPFELQMTDRQTASRFYDKLTLNGYVGTNEVFKDYNFYYCPDFAKNAINPSLSDQDLNLQPDPNSNKGEYIYVRSARQLNALGRNQYYWNKQKNTNPQNENQEFGFKQETDIDFGRYVKTYCGREFNLMDTTPGNPYRNTPIGRPNVMAGQQLVANNFRYVYDGGGHKIIDYCCTSENIQFTGLFGEVQHGILKNIVMEASNPEAGSAFVESAYTGTWPGTGALAGLVYVDGKDSYNQSNNSDDRVASVKNCSVSGYRVTYSGKNMTSDAAIGGLVGFNFGRIENSSAVNKMTECSNATGGVTRILVGGLVGSLEGWGTIRNCYAGGSLGFSSSTWGGSSIGGICGGDIKIYGYGYNKNQAGIFNSYSYCSWDGKKIDKSGNLTLYGVAPDIIRNFNCCYLDEGRDLTLTLTSVSGAEAKSWEELRDPVKVGLENFGYASAENSFPWPSDPALSGSEYPFPAIVRAVDGEGNEGGYVHYGSWPVGGEKPGEAYLCYFEQYGDGSTGWYYYSPAEKGIQKNEEYDDSNKKVIVNTGYGVLCQPEKNFEVLCEPPGGGKPSPDYRRTGSEVLAETEAGREGTLVLYEFSRDFYENYLYQVDSTRDSVAIGLSYVGYDGMAAAQTLYLNAMFAADISDGKEPEGAIRFAEVRTAEQLQNLNLYEYGSRWEFHQTHDIDAGDAGLLVNLGYTYYGTEGELGCKITGLKKPLFKTNSGNLYQIYVEDAKIESKGDASILVLYAEENSDIKNCVVGGSVRSTGGAAAGLVVNNSGNIMGCGVMADVTADVTADIAVSSQAAGLAVFSSGTISECFAKGTVHSNGFASGFVMTMYPGAQIKVCYSNCRISAQSAAAGFVYYAAGKLEDCYTVGEVFAGNTACGFFGLNEGTIQNSYSLTEIKDGLQKYGFGAVDAKGSGCYWVSSEKFNGDAGISDNSGAEKFAGLHYLAASGMADALGTSWIRDNAAAYPDTPALGSVYPYPRLRALTHYGDWPVSGELEGEIGAFQVYLKNKKYYMNGAGYRIGDGSEEKYYEKGNNVKPTQEYGIFLSDNIDANGWKVIYRYKNFWGNEKEEVVELTGTEVQPEDIKNSGKNMRIFTFSLQEDYHWPRYTMINIVIIAPERYNKSFTFTYDGEDTPVFEYDDPN